MKGNHVLKVVAHAQPPMTAQPGFRQYDFFVDGQSFFTFPKVFRLGLAPNDPRAAGGGKSTTGSSSKRTQQQNMNNNTNNMNNTNAAERSIVPLEYNNNTNGGYNNYATAPNLTPYTNDGGGGGGGRSVNSTNIVSIEAPHNPEEEDAYLRQAIENSLKESPSSSPNRPSITNGGGGGGGGAAVAAVAAYPAHPAPGGADAFLLDFMAAPSSAAT